MSEKYNGWTNYETWAVSLWMDNDQGSSAYYSEQAQEFYDEASASDYSTREENATRELADRLKDDHEENNPCEGSNNVYTDLMRAALSEVNWYEIAEHLMAEVEKEEEAETEEASQ